MRQARSGRSAAPHFHKNCGAPGPIGRSGGGKRHLFRVAGMATTRLGSSQGRGEWCFHAEKRLAAPRRLPASTADCNSTEILENRALRGKAIRRPLPQSSSKPCEAPAFRVSRSAFDAGSMWRLPCRPLINSTLKVRPGIGLTAREVSARRY
jgi:hypothetical protein